MTSVEDKIEHPISEDEDDEIDDWMKSVENKIAILEKSTEKLKKSTEKLKKSTKKLKKEMIKRRREVDDNKERQKNICERIEAFERLFKIDKNEVNYESE